MTKLRRIMLALAALLALAGFGAQIAIGIATGTASPCGPAGSCAAPQGK